MGADDAALFTVTSPGPWQGEQLCAPCLTPQDGEMGRKAGGNTQMKVLEAWEPRSGDCPAQAPNYAQGTLPGARASWPTAKDSSWALESDTPWFTSQLYP